MTELSPSAQAVFDAYLNAPCGKSRQSWVAAALRAAALNFRTEMKGSVSNDFVRGVLATANALEEIASELEAQ